MRDEEKWKCPWCGRTATRVRQSIGDSRECECGAIAIGAPGFDWDEVTDEAIGLFSVPIRPESRGDDDLLREDIRRDGVEIREGVSDPDMGHPSGWPGGYEYTWFRRAADRPGACLPYEPLGRVPVLDPAEESASPSRFPPDLVVMKPVTPSLLQRAFGFVTRSTIIHVLSYLIVGMASYFLVVRNYWTGDRALPWLRDPEAEFVQRWFLPAQFARGVLYGIALFPLREPLLRMKRLGGLVVASLLLLVGSIAGISGIIEDWVYTTTFHLGLFLAHLPEVVIQTLLYGYLLLAWEGWVESQRRTGEQCE